MLTIASISTWSQLWRRLDCILGSYLLLLAFEREGWVENRGCGIGATRWTCTGRLRIELATKCIMLTSEIIPESDLWMSKEVLALSIVVGVNWASSVLTVHLVKDNHFRHSSPSRAPRCIAWLSPSLSEAMWNIWCRLGLLKLYSLRGLVGAHISIALA